MEVDFSNLNPICVHAPEISNLIHLLERIAKGESVVASEVLPALSALVDHHFFDVSSEFKAVAHEFGLTKNEQLGVHTSLRHNFDATRTATDQYREICIKTIVSRESKKRYAKGVLRFGDGIDAFETEAVLDIDTGSITNTEHSVVDYSWVQPALFVSSDFYVNIGLVILDTDPKLYVVDKHGMETLSDSYTKSKYNRFVIRYHDEGSDDKVLYLSKRHLDNKRPTLDERIRDTFSEISGLKQFNILGISGLD